MTLSFRGCGFCGPYPIQCRCYYGRIRGTYGSENTSTLEIHQLTERVTRLEEAIARMEVAATAAHGVASERQSDRHDSARVDVHKGTSGSYLSEIELPAGACFGFGDVEESADWRMDSLNYPDGLANGEEQPVNIAEQWVVFLTALLLWREARGASHPERVAVACSVRNRVKRGGWWGKTYAEVVTKPAQYSSFPWFGKAGVIADKNGMKWPIPGQPEYTAFEECFHIARNVISEITSDTTDGATHFIDRSIWDSPPNWVSAVDTIFKKEIGDFRFYVAK